MPASSKHTAMSVMEPVWYNTYWVKNALEQWEGVSKYATELNKVHGHFWGLTQKFALDAAVIGLCKLYDTSNKRYPKHTVHELLDYLQKNLTQETGSNVQKNDLLALTISEEVATQIISDFRSPENFKEAKVKLINAIDSVLPNKDSGSPLERIFMVRDKIVAHQEQLSDAIKEQTKSLPPLEDMEKLNQWANSFCQLFAHIFVPNTMLGDSCISARMAALNIVKKVLGRTFNDPAKSSMENYEEQRAFYERIK
jgi:hypothetical protein